MDSIFIFSRENLFSRMLYFELEDKYDVTLYDKAEINADGADLLIYNADGYDYKPLSKRAPAVIAYGIKQRGDYVLSDNVIFFHRPFAVSELQYETERILSDKCDDKATLRFTHKRVYVNNEKIPLTDTEFSVLSYLNAHRGEVVSREEIKRIISRRENNAAASNCADVYISFLRKKLEYN